MISKIHRTILLLSFILLCSASAYAEQKQFSLENCIEFAWSNSTDIGRAQNSIRSWKSNLETAKAAEDPSLTLGGDVNSSWNNKYDSSSQHWERSGDTTYSVSLSSSMTLYDGGKAQSTIKQNRLSLAASQSSIETEKNNISLNILTAYINILLAKEKTKNAEVQLSSTQKQLEYATVRQAQGIISKSELLNMKSQYASDTVDLLTARSDQRMYLFNLMQLMNMPVDDDFDIESPDVQTILSEHVETDAVQIYQSAVENRPEIRTAELELESAEKAIETAKADDSTNVSIYGVLGTGYSSDTTDSDILGQTVNDITPTVGLAVSIPLYQRKQNQNLVAQAAIVSSNYRYSLLDLKNSLRKAIEQACLDSNTALLSYKASREQYNAMKESYRVAEAMFKQGAVNSVDYLTAKNNLVSAENDLVQAKYNVVLQRKLIDYYRGEPIRF